MDRYYLKIIQALLPCQTIDFYDLIYLIINIDVDFIIRIANITGGKCVINN